MSEVLSFSKIESAMGVFKLEFVDICRALSLRVAEQPQINELTRSTLLAKLELLRTCAPHIPFTPSGLQELLNWTEKLDNQLDIQDCSQEAYDEMIQASVLSTFH
ncbi:MAG: hypothetical protein CMF25_03165 [Kangiellaceae bacterium]|nr:hypothetical protein [Kangiellaceae bacterium]